VGRFIGEVEALLYYGLLCDVEAEAREQRLDAVGRQRLRAEHSRPVAENLQKWLILHRSKVPDGSATAKAIGYSSGRREALTRYLDDGDLPIDNNWLENRIRRWLSEDPTALYRITACRPARRRHHEPDPIRQAQLPRSVSLSQGRARVPADAAGKQNR